MVAVGSSRSVLFSALRSGGLVGLLAVRGPRHPARGALGPLPGRRRTRRRRGGCRRGVRRRRPGGRRLPGCGRGRGRGRGQSGGTSWRRRRGGGPMRWRWAAAGGRWRCCCFGRDGGGHRAALQTKTPDTGYVVVAAYLASTCVSRSTLDVGRLVRSPEGRR